MVIDEEKKYLFTKRNIWNDMIIKMEANCECWVYFSYISSQYEHCAVMHCMKIKHSCKVCPDGGHPKAYIFCMKPYNSDNSVEYTGNAEKYSAQDLKAIIRTSGTYKLNITCLSSCEIHEKNLSED
ncbi:unnamed protein product, partial [Meganyctiphanes norvegica]